MNLNGWTKAFSIGGGEELVQCYLKIGIAGTAQSRSHPHLSNGDICYIDLTIKKGSSEMRAYEVLMEMANMAILMGAKIEDVANILIGHKFMPAGVTNDTNIPLANSICDFIGKYLKSRIGG